MANVPDNIMAQIRRDNPIEVDGLTFYPVLMDEFDTFNIARVSLEFMQQRLPIKYISMPFLSAVYAYDLDLVISGERPSGLFQSVLVALALGLKMGVGLSIEKRISLFKIEVEKNNPTILRKLTFLLNGEEWHSITPLQFNRYRPILAAQNAVELPDEAANLDILESENILREKNTLSLDINTDDAISSVAVVMQADEKDIYGWTIRKFYKRKKSIDRIMNFLVCGIGELSGGVKWKGGNPTPNWCFDRKQGNSPALISAEKFLEGQKGAVSQRNSL